VQKEEYEAPEVGTVTRLKSRYADTTGLDLVKKIAVALENKGWITGDMMPVGYVEKLRIRLDDYVNKYPVRMHQQNWVDGGKQVAVMNADTLFPFFFNNLGSRICKFCDGKRTVGEMIAMTSEEFQGISHQVLNEDILKFLLLLEELDLIEFIE